jgi:hypothetical protein
VTPAYARAPTPRVEGRVPGADPTRIGPPRGMTSAGSPAAAARGQSGALPRQADGHADGLRRRAEHRRGAGDRAPDGRAPAQAEVALGDPCLEAAETTAGPTEQENALPARGRKSERGRGRGAGRTDEEGRRREGGRKRDAHPAGEDRARGDSGRTHDGRRTGDRRPAHEENRARDGDRGRDGRRAGRGRRSSESRGQRWSGER